MLLNGLDGKQLIAQIIIMLICMHQDTFQVDLTTYPIRKTDQARATGVTTMYAIYHSLESTHHRNHIIDRDCGFPLDIDVRFYMK